MRLSEPNNDGFVLQIASAILDMEHACSLHPTGSSGVDWRVKPRPWHDDADGLTNTFLVMVLPMSALSVAAALQTAI